MSDSNIRLFAYVMSPYAAKVHCFLLYKKLDFECVYINPFRVEQDLPTGKQIPVLIGFTGNHDMARADEISFERYAGNAA